MKHSGRKLTWLWNYSKNELRTNYSSQKYILMTSTFQTAILLQFNRNDTLSLEELHIATSIPKDHLAQVLTLLTRPKVLTSEEEDQYDFNPSTLFKIPRWSYVDAVGFRFQVQEDSG